MSERVYRLSQPAAVASQFRACMAEAERQGEFDLAVRAAKCIVDELKGSPLDFGESRGIHSGAKLLHRIAFARPLAVLYAVHEESKNVFLKSFAYVGR